MLSKYANELMILKDRSKLGQKKEVKVRLWEETRGDEKI